MESFSCTALHFITSLCQLYLIYKVSKGQRMWSINLWVGDCTRERGDGRIYHSLTWQNVLQLSLVELEWVISAITLIRNDLSQVYTVKVGMSAHEVVWLVKEGIEQLQRPWRLLSKHSASVQVGLIAHHTGLSEVCVCTDGLYSPKALYECCKASWIKGFCLHRVMNREYMTVLFSGLHDTGSHKKVKGNRHEPFPPDRLGHKGFEVPGGCIMSPDKTELIILC